MSTPPNTYRIGVGASVPAAPGVGSALRDLRTSRRLSQLRMAELVECNHSMLGRIEVGSRTPSRDLAIRIADALQLDPSERSGWLMVAGYAPESVESLLLDEPYLVEAWTLVRDESVPVEIREDVRNMIGLLVRQARRASEQLERRAA